VLGGDIPNGAPSEAAKPLPGALVTGRADAAPAAGDPPSGKPKVEPAEAPPFVGQKGLHTT